MWNSLPENGTSGDMFHSWLFHLINNTDKLYILRCAAIGQILKFSTNQYKETLINPSVWKASTQKKISDWVLFFLCCIRRKQTKIFFFIKNAINVGNNSKFSLVEEMLRYFCKKYWINSIFIPGKKNPLFEFGLRPWSHFKFA